MDWWKARVPGAPYLRTVLTTMGGGAGVVLGIQAVDAIKQRPEFLQQLLNGGALYVGFAVVAMVLVDRRLAKSADLQARNVIAQEELARHVGELVERDDARDDAQQAAIRFVSREVEAQKATLASILEKVSDLHARTN